MKKISIVFILISVASLMIYNACSKKQETKSEVGFTGKNFVKVIKAEKKHIMATLEYSGKLKAEKSAYIAPEMSMKVIEYFVDEGDIVKKGDLLAKMDSTQFLQAKAQYENAKKSYERMKQLKQTGSIDQQTYDQVESGYKTAKAGYEFMLANTEITAPFDGVITLRTKHEGESFSPMMPGANGTASILRLVNLDKIKVTINISDRDINKVKVGQKAIINVDSEPDKDFIGKVTFVSPEADMMSGTFTCEISTDNLNHKLKPNQFARVKIVLAEVNNTIVIPQKAIINSYYVFIITDNIASKKEVILGIQSELETEVLSGVSEDDLVVVSGNVGLPNNAKVEIRH